jgi:hypothetical protein
MFIMIPYEAGRPCLIQVEHIAAVLPLEKGSTVALRVSVDAMMPDGATARIPMEIVTPLSVVEVAIKIFEAGRDRVGPSVVEAMRCDGWHPSPSTWRP